VVEKLDAEDGGGADEASGEVEVVGARGFVAARVVVHEEDGGDAVEEGVAEEDSGVDLDAVLAAGGDPLVAADAQVGFEEEDDGVFLVIVEAAVDAGDEVVYIKGVTEGGRR
jgi:hypothetical protein